MNYLRKRTHQQIAGSRTTAFAALMATTLAACGGGDGDGGAAGLLVDEPVQAPQNSAPTFAGAFAAQAAENTDAVLALQLADADGDALTIFLNGEDAASFTLDALAQTVSSNAPFDFEAPTDQDGDNVYRFTLTVSDGQAQVAQDFTLTVTNVSDVAPDFGGNVDVTVEEGQVLELPIDVFDADGDAFEVTLDGADAGLFTLDSEFLIVSANAPFDAEHPVDADGDNVYEFVLTASDGLAATAQPFTVEVLNVSDNAPLFAGDFAPSGVENEAIQINIEVADADGDPLTLTLGGADAALFTLDADTFAVSANSPFDFERPGDADGDNVYQFSVTAKDGRTDVEQAYELQIDNADEGPPVFAGEFDEVIVEGDVAVFAIDVEDPDGGNLTLTISGEDAGLLILDAGAATVTGGPFDFELPTDSDSNNRYTFTLTADNGDGQRTTQAYSLEILNLSDTPPAFAGLFDAQVDEGQAAAFTIDVVDADGDPLSLELAGADAAGFTLNAEALTVTANGVFDFERPEDADGDNVYVFTLSASDGAVTVTQAYSLEVVNVDEGGPIFAGVFDEVANEGEVIVFRIEVEDPDGDDLTLTSGGTDAALLTLDAGTRTVTAGPFDVEFPEDADGDNRYDFTLTADNGQGQQTTQAYSLTVLNISDAPPEFEGDFEVSVEENLVASLAFTVIDPDGDAVTIELDGEDAALFTLEANGLAVTATAAFDFENPADLDGDNVYAFTLTASDGADSTVQAVTVTVLNVGDSAFETLGALALLGGPGFEDFGRELAPSGDLDRDGFAELAVRAAGATFGDPPRDEAGRLVILDGASMATLTDTVTPVASLGSGQALLINGALEEEEIASGIATLADLDGDNLPELALSQDTTRDARVVLGTVLRDALVNETGPIELSEVGDGGSLGGALVITTDRDDILFGLTNATVEDIDGDGNDELFVCANNATVNGEFRTGRGYLVFSSALAATVAANGAIDVSLRDPLTAVAIDGDGDDDGFCDTVTGAGDVDGDGLGDVLVGVSPGFDDPGRDREAFLILGSALAAERAADGLITMSDAVANGQAIRFALVAEDGRSDVAVDVMPDMNGDGFDELLFGDRRVNGEQGEAYLVFGSDTLGVDNAGGVDLSDLGTTVAGVVMRADASLQFTGSLVKNVGDVDGDGLADVLITATQGRDVFDTGRVFLVSGSELVDGARIQLTDIGLDPEEIAVLPARGVEIADIPHFSFQGTPEISTAGDMNGDGLADIAIGTDGVTGDREVYIISGRLLAERMGPGIVQQRISIADLFPALAP